MNDKKRNSDTRNVIYKRTLSKQKIKDFGMVLLFCILLPYVIATFTGRVQGTKLETDTEGIFVRIKTDNGTEHMPVNSYIEGALAACIDIGMEEETLKAQAVVLRTGIIEAYDGRTNREENFIEETTLGQEYYSTWQLKKMWLENFENNFEKIQKAVEETEGVIMTYHGIAIKAPYFYVSAGQTRAGNYPYLKTAESKQDIQCEEFTSKITYPKEMFRMETEKLFGEGEEDISRYKIERDGAGYVTQITLNNKKIQGEVFRKGLNLPSACFELEETKKGICITVKGKGHGVGFDQYGANELAKKGKSYEEILKYYFAEIEIEKDLNNHTQTGKTIIHKTD